MNTWGAMGNQFNNVAPPPQQMNYGSPTPGQYMGGVQVPQYQNPYTSLLAQGTNMMGQDQRMAQQTQQQGAQNIGNMQNQMSQYPSYPNDAGAGSQSPYGPGAFGGFSQQQSPPMPGTPGAPEGSTASPLTSSQGFNPWSLTGEALSRSR